MERRANETTLERWNVERRDTDSRKSEGGKLEQPSSRPSIRQLEHGGSDNVPPTWNAEKRMDTLATAGTDHTGVEIRECVQATPSCPALTLVSR